MRVHTREVIGMNPYWDVNYMQSFLEKRAAEDPTVFHDYIILEKHKDAMMERYEENKEAVRKNIQIFLDSQTQMTGQWSMDIMQNGDDFWFIDMADAANSALSFCVPEGKLKENPENWIPKIS